MYLKLVPDFNNSPTLRVYPDLLSAPFSRKTASRYIQVPLIFHPNTHMEPLSTPPHDIDGDLRHHKNRWMEVRCTAPIFLFYS